VAELDKTDVNREVINPTRVRVGIKFLKNLGNFENVTLDFEIETTVRPGEHVDDALDRAYMKVDEHLGKRLKAILSDHR
jgi:hypothetical protein